METVYKQLWQLAPWCEINSGPAIKLNADTPRWCPTSPVTPIWCPNNSIPAGSRENMESYKKWYYPGSCICFVGHTILQEGEDSNFLPNVANVRARGPTHWHGMVHQYNAQCCFKRRKGCNYLDSNYLHCNPIIWTPIICNTMQLFGPAPSIAVSSGLIWRFTCMSNVSWIRLVVELEIMSSAWKLNLFKANWEQVERIANRRIVRGRDHPRWTSKGSFNSTLRAVGTFLQFKPQKKLIRHRHRYVWLHE